MANDYAAVVASPQPIGSALLQGSGLVLRATLLINLGDPGVVSGGDLIVSWDEPVRGAGVALTDWQINASGNTTVYGWLGGELVGSIERPAIALRGLPHWFAADPAWTVDALTWDGQSGSVWAVEWDSIAVVPEPAGVAAAAAGCVTLAAIVVLGRRRKGENVEVEQGGWRD